MALELEILRGFDNRRAAALAAYCMARLEHEAIGYETASGAFASFAAMFSVRANTVKNFRDSFDP